MLRTLSVYLTSGVVFVVVVASEGVGFTLLEAKVVGTTAALVLLLVLLLLDDVSLVVLVVVGGIAEGRGATVGESVVL